MKKEEKAALVMQKYYRRKVQQQLFKLLKLQRKNRVDKTLLSRRIILLRPGKKVSDKSIGGRNVHEFWLSAYVDKGKEEITFNITDWDNTSSKYDCVISYADQVVLDGRKKDNRFGELNYNNALIKFCNEKIEKLQIVDHVLEVQKDEEPKADGEVQKRPRSKSKSKKKGMLE